MLRLNQSKTHSTVRSILTNTHARNAHLTFRSLHARIRSSAHRSITIGLLQRRKHDVFRFRYGSNPSHRVLSYASTRFCASNNRSLGTFATESSQRRAVVATVLHLRQSVQRAWWSKDCLGCHHAQYSAKRFFVSSSALSSSRTRTDCVARENAVTVLYDVKGMRCGGCSANVAKALNDEIFVSAACVNLVTNTAAVTYDLQGKKGFNFDRDDDVRKMMATNRSGVRDDDSNDKDNANDDYLKEMYEKIAIDVVAKKGFEMRRREKGKAGVQMALEAQKLREMEKKKSTNDLYKAWGLTVLCLGTHVSHHLHQLGLHEYAHGDVLTHLANPWIGATLATMALLGPGRQILKDGLLAFKNGSPTMNSLVGIGALAAFALSGANAMHPVLNEYGMRTNDFFEEPVLLLAFILLGRALEASARARAGEDLASLSSLLPTEARLQISQVDSKKLDLEAYLLKFNEENGNFDGMINDEEEEGKEEVKSNRANQLMYASIDRESITPGDVVRVFPGETIPCDGVVVSGAASVDEASLTGEPIFVPKFKRSKVSAGCIVHEGPLSIMALKNGDESIVAGIQKTVEEAQSRPAPTQRIADAIAGPFVYSVMGISLATFVFWAGFGDAMFPGALMEAVGSNAAGIPWWLAPTKLATNVLVVACPCALGLATPTAVLVATSLAARRGILLRGGDVLERMAKVDCVVFDKTGTLTIGKPKVTEMKVFENNGLEALRVALAVESESAHPLAKAIRMFCGEELKKMGVNKDDASISFGKKSEEKTAPGFGVSALLDGERCFVGTPEWVQSKTSDNNKFSSQSYEEDLQSSTASFACVGTESKGILALFQLNDEMRPDAIETIKRFKNDLNCEVHVLSGDRQLAVDAAVQYISSHESNSRTSSSNNDNDNNIFTSARGNLSPADKAEIIESLKKSGKTVAMIGDGINDAMGLVAADVGIAASGGLDAAAAAAGVVLVSDKNEISTSCDAIELGRAALSKIRQNLAWALAYNAIGIPLAAGAFLPEYGISLNPSFSGAMMAFSSVAVVTNSLLLNANSRSRSSSSSTTQTMNNGNKNINASSLGWGVPINDAAAATAADETTKY